MIPNVDCWASTDGGYLWERRGTVAAHEPGTGRFNHAAGLAHDGALVALVSGYGPVPPPGQARTPSIRGTFLTNWVCRSHDGGRTWHKAETFTLPQSTSEVIPFGDIERSPDGALSCTGSPILLVELEDATDGGYPSSVQLADGTIVTTYYANRVRTHRRYHMGVVRWLVEEK